MVGVWGLKLALAMVIEMVNEMGTVRVVKMGPSKACLGEVKWRVKVGGVVRGTEVRS